MTNWLFHSNSAASPTGYGVQTNLFTPRIRDSGRNVVNSAFYGCEGTPFVDHNGILTLPRGTNIYGNDTLDGHMAYPHFPDGQHADAVMSLIDPFVLNNRIWGKHNWAVWTPVDGSPVFQGNADVIKSARWVMSMSKFGHTELIKAGFNPIYVPLAADSAQFRPVDRQFARARLGEYLDYDLTDKFLIVTVAANKGTPSRKNFREMFKAFKLFLEGDPEYHIAPHPDAVFYVHTEVLGVYQGEDLRAMAQAFGIADKVLFPIQYHVVVNLLSHDFLNHVYNAGDIFMLLSSEGFGVPIVEAQMAGCPVIVSDWTSNPELLFSGWTVAGEKQYFALSKVWWYTPHILDAVHKLERAYEARGTEAMRTRAHEGAQVYDIDHVFEQYMRPALERMEAELAAPVDAPALAASNGKVADHDTDR